MKRKISQSEVPVTPSVYHRPLLESVERLSLSRLHSDRVTSQWKSTVWEYVKTEFGLEDSHESVLHAGTHDQLLRKRRDMEAVAHVLDGIRDRLMQESHSIQLLLAKAK